MRRVNPESLAFVLRGRALCSDCLADNLMASRDAVDQARRDYMVPERHPGPCDGCLKQTVVHRLR
jgi:hypothetical protein